MKHRVYRIFLFCFVFSIILIAAEAGPSPTVKYNQMINTIAFKHGINSALIHSIIKVESNYNPWAVSSKGAIGLMQLMPETAEDYGVRDIYDPRQNVEAGVKHFKKLLGQYKGNTELALAAYNAGQEAVKKYGGIPPFPETKNYIQKVNSLLEGDVPVKKTIIYKFYDNSGKLVLTNNPHLKKNRLR